MGVSASRRQASGERGSGDDRRGLRYQYPPEDGENYFSTHYYLGHRKFECGDPELFLFGELADLNFLPKKPASFPYKQPHKSQPIGCLRSYINVQRESVKLVRSAGQPLSYNIEFIFDSDVNCQFTVFLGLPDTVELSKLPLGISEPGLEGVVMSESFPYSSGSDQQFKQQGYVVSPALVEEDKLTYDPENDKQHYPLVILMQSRGDQGIDVKQAQMTICSLDKVNSSGYALKVLKQKLLVDGVEYLLQEVYGLENKAHGNHEDGSNESEDSDSEEDLGAECVICITDVRDTILLPCRHLCLCNSCAANLRYQSSNCPICRSPFRALLQIQALEPLDPNTVLDDDEATGNPKYALPGYQCVPLLQALNGYNLEQRDEEENGDIGPSPQTIPDQQTVPAAAAASPNHEAISSTGSCVIPIEDEDLETDHVSLIPARPPTVINMRSSQDTNRRELYDGGDVCVSLPGTPERDQHQQVAMTPNEEMDKPCADGMNCASSVSSDTSVKSTDMLLSATK